MVVTRKDIDVAYRKFKHHVYYDGPSLLLRQQVISFEAEDSFETSLDRLVDALSTYETESSQKYFSDLISKITSTPYIKKLESKDIQSEQNGIITNQESMSYSITTQHQIDAPIEVHIISVLWILKNGYLLEDQVQPPPFANRLERIAPSGAVTGGLRLFKKYFQLYQEWRDSAIAEAKKLIESKTGALIVGLDLKNFYHSVRLDFGNPEYLKLGKPEDSFLNDLLFDIYKHYSHLFFSDEYAEENPNVFLLPIGLLSSGVLANWYLRLLDETLFEELKPSYYGRYVDDILMVLPCRKMDGLNSSKAILDKYFVSTKLLIEIDAKTGNASTSLPEYFVVKKHYNDCLKIQGDKLSVMLFDSNEPIAVLDKFLREIRKNSSEYKFLPEEEQIDEDFTDSAYTLRYDGSVNKLRSLKEFKEDKFGLSKFLAKRIFLALQPDRDADTESDSAEQLLKVFKGKTCLELSSLWEKTLTFFVVTGQKQKFADFFDHVDAALAGITSIDAQDSHVRKDEVPDIKLTYQRYLNVAALMAISLQPSFITTTINNKFNLLWKRIQIQNLPSLLRASIQDATLDIDILAEVMSAVSAEVKKFRRANMLRHNYVPSPILSYTKFAADSKNSLLIRGYDGIHNRKLLELDEALMKYSPRFVHFHELCLHQALSQMYAGNDVCDASYLEVAFERYHRINHPNEIIDPEKKTTLRNCIYRKTAESIDGISHIRIAVNQEKPKENLTVALGNWKIPAEVYSHAYLLQPKIKPERKKKMNKMLNEALSVFPRSPDLIVLPENSIPMAWLKWLCDFSQRHQIAMCFGLEHFVANKMAYNFVATLLPVRLNGFNTLVTIFRLKNHYSPGEVEHLRKFGYEVPKPKAATYNLFEWKNFHFTLFNCFELANISHRASFRSKVDCVIASAYNKDTNYFSNIVESVTRDVHSYFIMSNDSEYGDNRVSAPKATVSKDLIRLKGGTNSTILVCDLALDKLRRFQILEHAGQLDDASFKPTPPDFNKSNIMKRLGYNEARCWNTDMSVNIVDVSLITSDDTSDKNEKLQEEPKSPIEGN